MTETELRQWIHEALHKTNDALDSEPLDAVLRALRARCDAAQAMYRKMVENRADGAANAPQGHIPATGAAAVGGTYPPDSPV